MFASVAADVRISSSENGFRLHPTNYLLTYTFRQCRSTTSMMTRRNINMTSVAERIPEIPHTPSDSRPRDITPRMSEKLHGRAACIMHPYYLASRRSDPKSRAPAQARGKRRVGKTGTTILEVAAQHRDRRVHDVSDFAQKQVEKRVREGQTGMVG